MSILSFSGPRWTTRYLTLAAMLTAVEVVLGKISVGDPTLLKVSLSFIATALVGYFLGPWMGGLVMIVNDLISNTIFNTGGGMFFPGYTFSAFISGVIAGLFLYQQRVTWQRIFVYEFFQILISNVFFNTLWIYVMSLSSHSSSTTFMALLAIRLPKEVISWPIESLVILVILKAFSKIKLPLQQ
ncbi:folate family ECF transporter S component [Limosilactobacillus caecicola]|uniref:folate family ECF transporter S component n=1 Tax=Limosilactobacillus caecicola TaxID=2941332 RepID=UPI00203B072E|nr:folate family ECF transporter S component [Limosilactobacillus caecicola]